MFKRKCLCFHSVFFAHPFQERKEGCRSGICHGSLNEFLDEVDESESEALFHCFHFLSGFSRGRDVTLGASHLCFDLNVELDFRFSS